MAAIDLNLQDYLRCLAKRLDEAPAGSKKEIIQGACAFLGKCEQTIYELLNGVGWNASRKPRNDRGKLSVTKKEAMIVSCMVMESCRENGKKTLSVKNAIKIAIDNDLIVSGAAPSTYLRAMRAYGVHPDQIGRATPHNTLRSLHPNHAWQFDASVCVLFYMEDDGARQMPKNEFYKNKPQNFDRIKKKRVLRYLITDHYTGTFFVKYYLAAGENQETLFNFLMDAFAPKNDSREPFHGVPFNLLWDKGSANQSHMIKTLLDRLSVKHFAHEEGKPRAKGQVESGHNLVEKEFEGRLRLTQIKGIDDLNQKAQLWMRHYNSTAIHERYNATRYAKWQTIRSEELRLAPSREICQSLLETKPVLRTVEGNLTIRHKIAGFDPAAYSVKDIPAIRVGDKIEVRVNPYRAPNIHVIEQDDNGKEVLYECEPIQKDNAGFPVSAPIIGEEYKSPPDTETDQLRKEMAKLSYNVETEDEVKKARRDKKPLFDGAIDPFKHMEIQQDLYYMNRPGTSLNVPARAQVEVETKITLIQALKEIVPRLRQIGLGMTIEINELLTRQYPEGVPRDSLDEVYEFIVRASEVKEPMKLAK
ncbi:MAG: DDE-type integrase/transposase/recombinase [Gammaproteobacteria bacterium]|nr:DDE-type integrase/transposase/recombinase [Gammaproteobacteria bacterium]MCP5443357.1 DDE-type integrase/transposase/recombinase [Chromatiaceae bacterium]